ncbi:PAS domain S-box protein [Melioribacteraceae bacterium 4301-Me]|uniref:PAS domain S-box protein n=1 Tax=Pyranulibacter aquaticus TaxID=3163344 RepID=UPI003598F195
MYYQIIQNAILLVALSTLYNLVSQIRRRNEKLFKIISGIIFGCLAIIGMRIPFYYSPGIIYDGRSIILVLAGLFGGGTSAIISVIIAGAYRLGIGGSGVWAGLSTILGTAVTGLLFRRLYKNKIDRISILSLYVVGVIAHLVMLASQLLIQPFPNGIIVIKQIWLPIIFVFPIATLLIGLLLRNEERRFRAEVSLAEREDNLRITLNSIGDAVIATDIEGKITSMNPVAEELTGYNFEDVKNRKLEEVFNIVNAQTGEKVLDPVKKVLMTGKIVGLANHTKLISKSGEEYQIADSAAPIINEDGIVSGVVLVFRNVTQEYKMRENLKISEEKFRKAFFTSPDSININRLSDGKYVSINQGFTKIMGFTEADVIGKTSLELNIWVNPKDRERLVEGLKTNGIVENLEAPFRAKDGSIKIGLMSATIIELDGIPHILNITRDITEVKKQEHARQVLYNLSKISFTDISLKEYLSKIHEELKKLIKSDNFYIALYDKELNQYTFPYHVDEFDNYETDSPTSLDGSLTDYVRKTGKAYLIKEEEDKKLREAGEVKLVGSPCKVWMGAPLFDSSTGEVLGVIALQDYKDENAYTKNDLLTLEIVASQIGQFILRVKALQDLKLAKEKAEVSDRIKGEFMAQMSHEIRSPLNIITGCVQLIKEEIKEKNNSEISELFFSIDSATKRIIRTIDLILNYSELQASSFEPNYKKIDLREEVLNNVISEYRMLAENKNLKLSFNCKTDNTFLIGDMYSLTQVFANLIDNAIKFTKKGGIDVVIDRNPQNYLFVKVTDTGIGMSNEFIQHLFEPFRQEITGYTRPYEGNGLGLALVKKYCEINNAEIFVESKKGVGSAFTVIFK